MKCPTCNGSGEGGPVHVNTGFNSRTGRCKGYWIPQSCCPRCLGKGEVPAQMAQWIIDGKLLRKQRIDRNEMLHEAAARRGIDITVLSAMEQGKIEPVLTETNADVGLQPPAKRAD